MTSSSSIRRHAIRLLSLVAVVVAAGFSQHAAAQSGRVFDDLSLPSDILDMDRKFAIYLPPDYESSQRSYPVLYLLHGRGDDQTGWIQFGEVLRIADAAIRDGIATPMIIVMPDANTGVTGYFNSLDGEWRYEDFFFDELVPHVESTYRIKSEKRYRAISGLSMGGGGTFMYALHRPDLFSSAAPLSASSGPLTLEDLRSQVARNDNVAMPSDVVLQGYFERHSALELMRTLPEGDIRSVRWYIDCGDDDFLFEGNSLIHVALKKRQIPHEYRVRDGAHNWTYWRDSLPSVLEFVSQAFHQY